MIKPCCPNLKPIILFWPRRAKEKNTLSFKVIGDIWGQFNIFVEFVNFWICHAFCIQQPRMSFFVFIFLLFQQWMIGEFASDKFTYIWLCQGCGILAGAVVSGFLSDLVGRKTVLYVNLMMMSLAQGSLCILDDWVLFLISRGLVGIFAG